MAHIGRGYGSAVSYVDVPPLIIIELTDREQGISPLTGVDHEKLFADAEAFNAQHKLPFRGKRLQEGGDTLAEEIGIMRGKGIKCEHFVFDGVHEWQAWRKTAHCFLRLLFR